MHLEGSIKSQIETLLFLSGEPISLKSLAKIFGKDSGAIKSLIDELITEYEKRGIIITESLNEYQFTINPQNFEIAQDFVSPVRLKKLSQSALETLAIIAYKQPVRKSAIESIRGVKSDKVIENLIAKGFVKISGEDDSIGRPKLYATTKKFLRKFNLGSLKELPDIGEIDDIIKQGSEETEDSKEDFNE